MLASRAQIMLETMMLPHAMRFLVVMLRDGPDASVSSETIIYIYSAPSESARPTVRSR
jgi:hypothetical protein